MLESSKGTSLCCRCKRGRSIGVAKYARRKTKNECVLPLSQAPSVYPCWTTLPLPPLPRFTLGTQQRSTKSYKARNTKNSMRCRSHSHIISFVHLVVSIILATALLSRFSNSKGLRDLGLSRSRDERPVSVCGRSMIDEYQLANTLLVICLNAAKKTAYYNGSS